MSERTDNVVKLRREYDVIVKKVLAENDPDGVDIVTPAVGAWLDAENDLSLDEFNEYMKEYHG